MGFYFYSYAAKPQMEVVNLKAGFLKNGDNVSYTATNHIPIQDWNKTHRVVNRSYTIDGSDFITTSFLPDIIKNKIAEKITHQCSILGTLEQGLIGTSCERHDEVSVKTAIEVLD